MNSPFPGMDPYLEDPAIWRGFHHGFAEEVRAQLNKSLSSDYYADLEVHTVLEEVGILTSHSIYPDAAVLGVESPSPSESGGTAVAEAPIVRDLPKTEQHKLRTVLVRRTDTHRLVTAIEILSPYNKRGDGLDLYRAKRWRLIRSDVHLIEIDLLRSGSRPGPELQNPPIETDYLVLLNRYNPELERRRSEIWPVTISEPLPTCPVPLLPPDPDILLELTGIMKNVYDRSAYGRRIDYSRPIPPPPLRPEMEAWVSERLSQDAV